MIDTKISFDAMPQVMAEMNHQISEIKKMISNLCLLHDKDNTQQDSTESWLTVEDLCEYLPEHPTKQTIYNWIAKNEIPYYKKNRRIRFLKSEVEQWLLIDKKKSSFEIRSDISEYLRQHPIKH